MKVFRGSPSVDRVVEVCAASHGVTSTAVFSRSRTAAVAEARKSVCWVLRDELGMSLPAIGRAIGRHYSTVMHGAADTRRRFGAGGSEAERMAEIRRLLFDGGELCSRFSLGHIAERPVDYIEGLREPSDVCGSPGCGLSRAEHTRAEHSRAA